MPILHQVRNFVVHEQSGVWSVALRHTLINSGVSLVGDSQRFSLGSSSARVPAVHGELRVTETQSTKACLAALLQTPRAVTAVELSEATCDQALELIETIGRRFDRACLVVLAARELASHEWLARELGAAHFVASLHRLPEIVAVARRHFANLPAPVMGTAETIRATLPW